MLIFCRNTWYPIRELICSHGTLFVTTLAHELAFQITEEVIWLNQVADPISDSKPAPANLIPATTVALMDNPSASTGEQPVAPTQERSQPAAPRVSMEASLPKRHEERPGTVVLQPDLREVLQLRQGKLYITTTVGEIVVEGAHLKFWLNETPSPSLSSPAAHLEKHRDIWATRT
jgi:hypothetical protein